MITKERMLSPAEVAQLLGIHRDTLYRRWRAWGLRAYRVGGEYKFRESEIDSWLESRRLA